MSIFLTTPTGNVGRRVVANLIGAGADTVVLARDAARLGDRVRSRARVVEGSLQDVALLAEATAGAEALFLVVPPDYTTDDWRAFQLGIGRNVAEAVRRNGVQRVVLLSSAGAHRDDLLAISRLGEVERMLEAVAPHVVSLRAGFFFENFLSAVPTIRDHGAIYMRSAPESRGAMVATDDIGDVAARWLLHRTWTGHHHVGVHGPADLSFAEAADAIGRGVGRDVQYVQANDEQTRGALLAMGASAHVADEYTRMFVRMDEVGFDRAEPRTAGTTMPTTLESWAREVMRPLVEQPEPATA